MLSHFPVNRNDDKYVSFACANMVPIKRQAVAKLTEQISSRFGLLATGLFQ
jgi:hypothetical protein